MKISSRLDTSSKTKTAFTSAVAPAIHSMATRRRGSTIIVAVSGKGRFGKRPPPSFTLERGLHSSNDNSNDSGFGWDSNSESQFSWGSTEDLRSSGKQTSTFERRTCEKFLGRTGNPQINSVTSDIKPLIEPDQASNCAMTTVWASGKLSSTTTTSTPMIIEESHLETRQELAGQRNLPTLNVPAKRSRFNFQTPAIPLKSTNGLKLRNQNQNQGDNTPSRSSNGKKIQNGGSPTLASSMAPVSRDGRVQLAILAQPEEQHRARYQTEGSRGAIKDRKGNGFPAVRLLGYDKPTTLQIFIGSDQGKVSPHMFYQACKVSGKSSTPCSEKKVEGTMLIEIEFDPAKEMTISCDCVGILKERNVDVEQRFPFNHASSSRKKSTKCRLIFRTTIINSEGLEETLLATSLPILCTQPPGQPEICKKSLSECSAAGREELFIIGKNFLKDTKVIFQEESSQGELLWEVRAEVLKDYLQQNHLICVIPPYKDEHILSAVDCKVAVFSGGKMSEPNRFTYLPKVPAAHIGVPTIVDPCSQSQSIATTTLQQQLTQGQSNLSMSLPVLGGSLHTGVETIVGNTLSQGEATNMVQVTDMSLVGESRRASLTSAQSVSFDNNVITTSAMQQESSVVRELQSLLDQTSQHALSEISDAKERDGITSQLDIATTSFATQNFGGEGLVLGSIAYQNTTAPSMQPPPMALPLQLTNYPNITTQHQQLSPNLQQFQNSESVPMSCILNPGLSEMMALNTATITQSADHHLLTPASQNGLMNNVHVTHSLAGAIMTSMTATSEGDCLADQNIIVKTEPLSPLRIGVPPPPSTSGVNMMNIIGGEMQQSGLPNVITEMSDNELLSYINPEFPSCFDQVMKCG